MDLLFKKEDVPILDGILECLVRAEVGVCATDVDIQKLVQMGDTTKGVEEFEKPLMYYFDYFHLSNVGIIDTSENYTLYTLLRANEKTLPFYKNGGFSGMYGRKLKEQEQQEKLMILVDKQIKEINRNKWFSILALVISIVSLLCSVFIRLL